MKQIKARYVVGLTATPTRKDGHHPIVFMQCGPIRFSLSAREAAARYPFRHVVIARHTSFCPTAGSLEFAIQDAYSAFVSNADRNRQIITDILEAVAQGRVPLVLTHRTAHLEQVAWARSNAGLPPKDWHPFPTAFHG